MKKCLLTLLALACLLLPGCTGRQLEEELLVIVLGIDETDTGNIHLTVKVPSNSDSGGGGGAPSEGQNSSNEDAAAGGEQMGYLLLEATGKKFSDAMNLLHATTPRTLNFSQTREVVIGEKAAKSARFITLIHDVYVLPRMRAQAALVICKEDANSFATEQKPYVGMRLSRYVETSLSNYAGKGFVPTTTLGEALRDLGYGFQDPLLIYAAANSFEQSEVPNKSNVLDAEPGTLPRKSVNPIEFFGAAATDGISVSGVLTGYEMTLLHLLQGDVQSLSLQPEEDVLVQIFPRSPATLKVDLSVRPAVLSISVLCEAQYAAGFHPEEEQLREMLIHDIQRTIAHLQTLRCDGAGFGNIAVRQFATVEEWEALNWREVYAQARVEVEVLLQFREA